MKKNSKKIGTAVTAVILVLLIAGGVAGYLTLPHSLSYDIDAVASVGSTVEIVDKTADTVTIKNTENREFKILMFTDMHLDGKNDTSDITLDYFVNNIQTAQPDLVILGGDIITSALNRTRANQFCEILENLGVYWAGVLGNHEGDNAMSITRLEMMDIFTSYDHCLMLEGDEDVWGVCNYALNILNSDDTLCETFFFMDTGDECDEDTINEYSITKEGTKYDGVKTSQVEWYKATVSEIKQQYGERTSMVVIHIPLPQYQTAAEECNDVFDYGSRLENICCSAFDSGLFDAIKESGSTAAVFCGHDHLNSFSTIYEGIELNYMQPSGYGSYTTESRLGYEEQDWIQGYTELILRSDGSYRQLRYRNSAPDELTGVTHPAE